MTVGSPLEMYATHFGWISFNLIMGLLMSSFIILTPLVIGVASAWFSGIQNTGNRPGVLSAMRRVELRLLTFVLVFLFCARPSVPLELDELNVEVVGQGGLHAATETVNYAPSDDPTNAAAPMGTNISALKASFGGDPVVPYFWMLVMQLSSGLTHAFVGVFPETFDIQAAQQDLREFNFHDQGLASELDAFRDDCYKVARAKFDAWTTDGRFYDNALVSAETRELLEEHPDMVNWIGSPIFRDTPGLYAACPSVNVCGTSPQAMQDIGGWPYDQLRDGPREATYAANGFGRPYCQEWWEHEDRGLRGRILTSTQPGGNETNLDLGRYVGILWTMLSERGDLQHAEDVAIQRTIENNLTTAAVYTNPILGANDSANRGVNHGVGPELLGALGSMWGGAKAAVTTKVLKTALYMLQGVLLFLVYALLPFALLFTGMSVRSVLTGGLLIFGLKFMTGIWALTYFIDQTLHQMLFPDWGETSLTNILNRPVHIAEAEAVFNMVAMGMYVIFPLIWLTIIGWAGVEIGRSVGQSMGNTEQSASSSGSTGMSAVTQGGMQKMGSAGASIMRAGAIKSGRK